MNCTFGCLVLNRDSTVPSQSWLRLEELPILSALFDWFHLLLMRVQGFVEVDRAVCAAGTHERDIGDLLQIQFLSLAKLPHTEPCAPYKEQSDFGDRATCPPALRSHFVVLMRASFASE